MNSKHIVEILKRQPGNQWGVWSMHKNGRYCALGWLLHSLGYSDFIVETCGTYREIADILGVGREDALKIALANDRACDHDEAVDLIAKELGVA